MNVESVIACLAVHWGVSSAEIHRTVGDDIATLLFAVEETIADKGEYPSLLRAQKALKTHLDWSTVET